MVEDRTMQLASEYDPVLWDLRSGSCRSLSHGNQAIGVVPLRLWPNSTRHSDLVGRRQELAAGSARASGRVSRQLSIAAELLGDLRGR